MSSISKHFRGALLLISFLLLSFTPIKGQIVIGTEGLLNVPTADMRPSGTFDGGASVIQKDLLYKKSYITGIYYIDFTPFNWMEITYRETLIRNKRDGKVGYHEQDRSTTIRLRPLKEGKYWPGVVIGANDIYSDHGGSKYTNIYGVLTKHYEVDAIGTFSGTLGYSYLRKKGTAYDGFMGGISFAPAICPNVQLMADYDTQAVNVGVTAFLWRHLHLTCFTHKFTGVNATISYQYTIPY